MSEDRFGSMRAALEDWKAHPSRDSGWPVLRALCADLSAGPQRSAWQSAAGDDLPRWMRNRQVKLSEDSTASALSHLSWAATANTAAWWIGREASRRTEPNPFLGTEYDVLWLDVRCDDVSALTLPDASLRRFREHCIQMRALEDSAFAAHLRRSLVVLATLHGSKLLLPDLVVAGPARDGKGDGVDPLVNVRTFPMSRELRRGDSLRDIVTRLQQLAPLMAGAEWRDCFGSASGDVRTLYRNATRAALEELLGVIEDGAGRRAPADELVVLREAATLVFFRVMFLMEAERRGLLYATPGGRPPEGRPSLEELATAPDGHPPGTVLRRFAALTRAVRAETGAEPVALRGASIFATPPTPDFSPALADWLRTAESPPADLPDELGAAWDRALCRVAAVASGQVSERYERAAASGAVGFGGAEHAQRVLGDVYEQILAMTPRRAKSGAIELVVAGGKDERRALGAHYTPEEIVAEVVRPTLGTLFRHHWDECGGDVAAYEQRLAGLRVLDPAMGSAHFLTVAALELARERAWVQQFGRPRDFGVHEPLEVPDPERGLPEDPDARAAFRKAVRQLVPDLVRTSCFGVDVNPLAAELGKLSLWLFTMTVQSEEHPELTFLDGNIRCGDSLVGLRFPEALDILKGRLDPDFEPKNLDLFGSGGSLEGLRKRIARFHDAMRLPRAELAAWLRREGADVAAGDEEDTHLLRQRVLAHAERAFEPVRWVHDLAALAEYWQANGTPEGDRDLLASLRQPGGAPAALPPDGRALARELRDGRPADTAALRLGVRAAARALKALHWELELPDVFHATGGGFDAIVTNPPFIGDRDLRGRIGKRMVEYLRGRYTGSDTPDYAGFFVHRYDALVRERGAVAGTLGPNTLGQAKNRRVVLVPLVRATAGKAARFLIRRAVPSLEWPGDAAVYICELVLARPGVSDEAALAPVEHDAKGKRRGLHRLAGGAIGSFLDTLPDIDFAEAPSTSPGLAQNGMFLRGKFQRPRSFLEQVPEPERAALAVYLNNEDVQQQVVPGRSEVVIDFYGVLEREGLLDLPADDQRQWLESRFPYLMGIAAETVGNVRSVLPDDDAESYSTERWWLFARPRPEIRAAMKRLGAVVPLPAVTKVWSPTLLPTSDPETGMHVCPMHKLFIVPTSSLALLASVTAASFECHARRVCATLKTDLSFSPTEAFPGFPLPWPGRWSDEAGRPVALPPLPDMETALGPPMRALLDWREALLLRPSEHGLTGAREPGGPTDLYNLYDDPAESSPAIERLRALHRELLAAVLAAYGWSDLRPTWVFDRPWIDGTNRYVPSASDRRELIPRLAALAATRREAELALCLEHLLPFVKSVKTSLATIRRLAKEHALTLTNDEIDAALALGEASGRLRREGAKHWVLPAQDRRPAGSREAN